MCGDRKQLVERWASFRHHSNVFSSFSSVFLFRCVLASLQEGLSVGLSVRPSVHNALFSNARKCAISISVEGEERGRGLCGAWRGGRGAKGVARGADASDVLRDQACSFTLFFKALRFALRLKSTLFANGVKPLPRSHVTRCARARDHHSLDFPFKRITSR